MSEHPSHEPPVNAPQSAPPRYTQPRYAPPRYAPPRYAPPQNAQPQPQPQPHTQPTQPRAEWPSAPQIVAHPHPYPYARPAQRTNGQAVTALICGLVGIVLGIWTPIPFLGLVAAVVSFVPALLGVIFGHLGYRQAQVSGVGRGAARTGMVLGYVVIGLILVTTFVWIMVGMTGFAGF